MEATQAVSFHTLAIDIILKNRFGSDPQAIDMRKHLLKTAAAAAALVPDEYTSEVHNQILSLTTLGEKQALNDDVIANAIIASL